MNHQTHTIELRNWFVDGDCNLNLQPCYLIRHLVGENEIFYAGIDDGFLIKEFYDRAEAEAFAKQLNEQAVPETYTYNETTGA